MHFLKSEKQEVRSAFFYATEMKQTDRSDAIAMHWSIDGTHHDAGNGLRG